jgi:hypothetical protein
VKKCALLDTDFISKTYSVQDGGNHLIDRVMESPEYEFFVMRKSSRNLIGTMLMHQSG